MTKMLFEDILEEVGGFGRYQKVLCFLLIPFTTGICGMAYYAQLIVLATPAHRCSLTPDSDDGLAGITASYHEKCQAPTADTLNGTVPCTHWHFDNSTLFPTLTSEESWVCGEAWRPYTILTAFWVGNMVGAWCLGLITDRFGRRPVVLICPVVYGVAGMASAFVTNYYGFLALRTLVGSVHHTLSHLPYVLVLEYCNTSRRVVPLLTIMMSYTLGTMITPVLAYSLWSWKSLIVITAAPALALVLVYRWVPESALWQLTQGREEDAIKTLHHIAKVNGKDLSLQDVTRMVKETTNHMRHLVLSEEKEAVHMNADHKTVIVEHRHSEPSDGVKAEMITSILKYPILRKRIILVMIVWMAGCICYYGHTQNTSHLGDHLLVNYFLGAAVEIPAWSAPWLIERFGRRPPLVAGFLISGVVGIVYAGLETVASIAALRVGIGLLGRLSVTVAYYIALQYGPELFPTVVRGQGVALAETLGGVAIFLSPSVVYLEEYLPGLPLLVLGLVGLVAGAVAFLLPETKGVTLPNSLQEAEDAGRGQKNGNKFCLNCTR